MAEIKKSIRKRKRGEPVRLEFGKKCNREIREFLVDALDVTEREIYFQRGPLDLTFLSKFAHIKGCEDMCFEPIVPVNPPAEFCGYDDIFEAIREKDRLVHHPYESFDVVVDFVKKAATDRMFLPSSKPCTVSAEIHRLLRLLSRRLKTASR